MVRTTVMVTMAATVVAMVVVTVMTALSKVVFQPVHWAPKLWDHRRLPLDVEQ